MKFIVSKTNPLKKVIFFVLGTLFGFVISITPDGRSAVNAKKENLTIIYGVKNLGK